MEKIRVTDFGSAVAISADGRTIAVGGDNHDGVAGSQTVATSKFCACKMDNNWVQLGEDLEGTQYFMEWFGQDVALSSDGNTVAIGGDWI